MPEDVRLGQKPALVMTRSLATQETDLNVLLTSAAKARPKAPPVEIPRPVPAAKSLPPNALRIQIHSNQRRLK